MTTEQKDIIDFEALASEWLDWSINSGIKPSTVAGNTSPEGICFYIPGMCVTPINTE